MDETREWKRNKYIHMNSSLDVVLSFFGKGNAYIHRQCGSARVDQYSTRQQITNGTALIEEKPAGYRCKGCKKHTDDPSKIKRRKSLASAPNVRNGSR
ncbi:MAG: hypothetical protein QF486_04825 [Candidatus Woesearchaeota archaeon]|nr:hypothetical protein [Candidatus Woesearchaeota archaeon]MDP7198915.1 hypothetical protein [Candidatus Woesearchaeota archaeon]MDP7467294.1 hypothetical protein [Candidatus Woesearchaeota archaeon]